jgi:hypothetical protein
MAEVYWMNGFESRMPEDGNLSDLLAPWMEKEHLRPAWIKQVHFLYDQPAAGEEWQKQELPGELEKGFVYSLAEMEEHFFMQQVIRRMRLDEVDSQLVLTLREGTLTAALFMSHRQVGRSNLRPQWIVGEQMAVLRPEPLHDYLFALPQVIEMEIFLSGTQPETLAELVAGQKEPVPLMPFSGANLGGIFLTLSRQEELKNKFGLIITRTADQPALITSVESV